MKYYSQTLKADSKGELKEALGSFAVVVLDGRNSLETMVQDAKQHARRENADGWRVVRANNGRFVDSDRFSGYVVAQGDA